MLKILFISHNVSKMNDVVLFFFFRPFTTDIHSISYTNNNLHHSYTTRWTVCNDDADAFNKILYSRHDVKNKKNKNCSPPVYTLSSLQGTWEIFDTIIRCILIDHTMWQDMPSPWDSSTKIFFFLFLGKTFSHK